MKKLAIVSTIVVAFAVTWASAATAATIYPGLPFTQAQFTSLRGVFLRGTDGGFYSDRFCALKNERRTLACVANQADGGAIGTAMVRSGSCGLKASVVVWNANHRIVRKWTEGNKHRFC